MVLNPGTKGNPSFHLSELLDNATDLIQSTDLQGNILFVNKSWLRIIGYSSNEVIGLNVMEIIHPESKEHCLNILGNLDKIESLAGESISLISKCGRRIYTSANINCRYDEMGKCAGTQAIFRDITKEREASEVAEKNEARFKLLIESANDTIYNSDPSGEVLYMNSLGEQLLGYPMNEITGAHFNKFVREDYRKEVAEFYANQFKNRIDSTYLKFPIRRKDGNHRWVGQTIRTLLDKENPEIIEGYIGVVRDITDEHNQKKELIADKKLLEEHVSNRTLDLEKANKLLIEEVNRKKEIEQNLKIVKREYEHLFQNAHDAIIVFRADGEVVLEANRKACEIYGFTHTEFVGKSLLELSVPSAARNDWVKRTLESSGTCRFQTTQKDKEGNRLLIEVNAAYVNYQNHKAIISINRDVTAGHELNLQLEAERKQKLSALIDGQELERKRIAQELHDGIGQMLTSLIRMIRKLEVQGELSVGQYEGLKESEKLADNIIDETRRISKNLMPSVLMDFGLDSALRSMLELVNRGEAIVEFQCNKEIPRLNTKTEIGIYRIIQEAVTNAVRHANAVKIEVFADVLEEEIIFHVKDNGDGFNVGDDNLLVNGNGISNMLERAQMIGAQLDIKSVLEKGSEIKLCYKKDE